MSQQSVTFLSQPSNELHKPAKPIGGTARFKPGVAGNLTLKSAANDRQSETHNQTLTKREKWNTTKPMLMNEYHYSVNKMLASEYQRLGALDLPPKPVGALPSYSGFIPRKEATNCIGCTAKIGNMMAMEQFLVEREGARKVQANIRKPDSTLKTPHTGDY